LARYAVESHGLTIRQACRAVKISRTAFYYQAKLSDDERIVAKLRLLAEARPRLGVWQDVSVAEAKRISVEP